jgi:hypothetical protein
MAGTSFLAFRRLQVALPTAQIPPSPTQGCLTVPEFAVTPAGGRERQHPL